jgi:flagellar hook-basal body complex protein FliE
MLVNDLIQSRQFDPLQQKTKSAGGNSASGETFAATLSEFVQDVNTSQAQAGETAERMIKGENVDIHDVMIASEKAKTSFQLLLELRNKALDMYREAIRVQV